MKQTFADLRKHRDVFRFLLAHMIYADGLVALFAFGGLYASGVFNLSVTEVIQFGITLNVSAGLGAFSFAWIDDWLGSKRTIVLALIGLIISLLAAIAAQSVTWLWAAGIGIGVFVGPAQATSRSLMARLSPPQKEAEYFGLFALSGRATSFVGPAIVAVATDVFGSQRAGLACILILFVVGLLMLLPVEEPQPRGSSEEPTF
jgi:UMF1 family MFS transporter